MIQVLDKKFVPYIDQIQIQEKVAEIAKQIDQDYKDKQPLFLGILNGSFVFASDLYKCINTPSEITFVKLASYSGTTSQGDVVNVIGLDRNITDRHNIIIEDIVDTGNTLSKFIPTLIASKPKSVQIVALLRKPEALQHQDLPVKYIGFDIPNKFVVGYGLDYDGYGRNIPAVYQITED